MDRSEHALFPEWLKSGSSVPAGGSANHLSASASLHTGNMVYLRFVFIYITCLVAQKGRI